MSASENSPAPEYLDQGSYTVAYSIQDQRDEIELPKLLDTIDKATVRHTGWPPFWVPTRQEIRPRPVGKAIVCNLFTKEKWQTEPGHCDYWMVTNKARAVLIRGFQEDDISDKWKRGTKFDITLPVWRIGECILQSAEFANKLELPNSKIEFQCHWRGLRGRQLASLSGNRFVSDYFKCDTASHQEKMTFHASDAKKILPELLHPFLKNLYSQFDFFELPKQLVDEEIQRMRSNRF